MEKCIYALLIEQYKENCEKVSNLALNTVAESNIRVFKSLSLLGKHYIVEFLTKVVRRINSVSAEEENFVITRINDVLTTVSSHNELFVSCVNGSLLDYLLSALIKTIMLRANEEELCYLQLEIENMIKFVEKLKWSHSKICLESFKLPSHIRDLYSVKKNKSFVVNNSNKISKDLTNFVYKIKICDKNLCESNLLETSKTVVVDCKIDSTLSDISNNNASNPVTKNAFEILMKSRGKK